MAFQGVGKPKLFLINVKQSLSDHFVQGGIMVEYKHQVEHCFINTFSSFKFQTYLSACKMEKNRHYLSRLRVLWHTLRIERSPTLTPIHERICHTCNVLDDKFHFALVCPFY